MATYDPTKNNPLLSKGLDMLKNRANPTQTTTDSPSLGWADNISDGSSATELLKKPEVLADLRSFYKERDGADFVNDEELVDKFYSDRAWRNLNTVSMARDVSDAYSMSTEQTTRLAKIQKLYDALPNFYQEGGRGLSGLGTNAAAMVLDPINLVGGFFGKAAGATAMKAGAREMIKRSVAEGGEAVLTKQMRSQLVRRAAVEGLKAGAKASAIEGAVTGVGQDALMQARNEEIGLQDEHDGMQALGAGLMGAATGGLMGGAFGAAGGVYGGKVSRQAEKFKRNVFGKNSLDEITARYVEQGGTAKAPNSDRAQDQLGVAGSVDTEAASTGVDPQKADDVKTIKYIGAQRDQYKRNLDATVDQIRSESGEKALAEWRNGKIADKDKTASMKQAEDLQAGRTALEDLYKWPTMRQSLNRQLEMLSTVETPKPDHVARVNELVDKISRGDDAYESIVRAAAAGKEVDVDKIVMDFANFRKDPNALIMDAETGQTFGTQQAAPPAAAKQPGEGMDLAPAIAIENVPSTNDPATITAELSKVTYSKANDLPYDATYEQALRAKYEELNGKAFDDSAYQQPDEVQATAEATPAVQADEVPASAEAEAGLAKRYNALNNQIARLRKAVEAGTATPAQQERMTKLVSERDVVANNRKQMRERLAAAEQQAAAVQADPQPVIRTIEAEAAEAPLDVEGAASFLSEYGFSLENMKAEMSAYMKAKNPGNREVRSKLARQFVAEKIGFARSVAHLEGVMNKNGVSVAYMPDVMQKLIQADPSVPADMKAATAARYQDWLDQNAQGLFAKYMSENPNFELDDVLSIIRQNHGESMEKLIVSQLTSDLEDIVQFMGANRRTPPGWDKLTPAQQQSIDARVARARISLSGKIGSLQLSASKIDGLIEMQKQNLILETLAKDWEFAVRTSGAKLGDNYPIIVDPDNGSTVSGKVWNKNPGDLQYTTDSRDTFGLQSMLKKATGGRATGRDEYGNLTIEYPHFGTLLVRDIVRSPDGSIDFMRTTDGKYITKTVTLPNGRVVTHKVPKRFDAAESARRANEEAAIASKSNRFVKVKGDVANLKAGDQATAKQLAAAEVEAARSSEKRGALNKRTTGAPMDAEAEALNKAVRKRVVADAVNNALETSPNAPERAIAENLRSAEEYLGEAISLEEMERAWGTAESDTRLISVEMTRKKLATEAVENYRIHQDVDTLTADLNRINAQMDQASSAPKVHPDKPAGSKVEPRVYVYKGWEVDVRNHFDYKKTSDSTRSLSFMGEKVGDLTANKDGTATLMYTDGAGLEMTVKASSMDAMASHLPRIFGDRIEAAGAAGKLSRSFDEAADGVYPIDWKSSNTWGKQKRTVPVETQIDEPAKLTGMVDDWKANPDVSAINLDIPDGHVMAVHILEGDLQGVTRVENVKGKTPQTVAQILGGQRGKAYTVGYVPEGTPSASPAATRLFKAIDAEDPVYRAGAPDQGSARGKTPSIDQDDLGQIKLDGLSKIAMDQNDLPISLRDKGLDTLAKVHDLINSMENVPWARIHTKEQYSAFVKDLASLYEVRAKYAPKGIKLPTASRVQAMSQWKRIMTGYDGTSIATGIDALRRLAYNDRNLPILSGKEMDGAAGGYALPMAGSDAANQIFLNPAALNPDGKGSAIPQPIALLHEIAHWAYVNVLSDADRLQFWQSLDKYFDGGEVDMAAVRSRLPGIANEAEQMSPAELFANQFTQWAVTQGKVNNISLWSKMARYITQMAEAFGVRLRGDRASVDPNLVDIDADFVELFSKILPETDPMYNRYVELHKTLEDIRKLDDSSHIRTASVAAKALIDFDDMRRKLDDAIETGNPMDLESALDEVSREIYGKVGGKAGAYKHTPKAGKVGTGQGRLRLFDGKYAATAKARQGLMKAHYEWREFQKALHADSNEAISRYKEMSTDDVNVGSESGDLNSSFEQMADLAYTTMDDDLSSALTFHANNLINALANGQDELRSIISRTGKLEGKTIRVAKDGGITATAESPRSRMQRMKSRRRAAAQNKRAEEAVMAAFTDISNTHVRDREPLAPTSVQEAATYSPVAELSNKQLTDEYKSLAGIKNARKKELEAEIKGRIASMPEAKVQVPEPQFEDMPLRALERDLFQSIKRGKFDDMNKIANAMAWKQRNNLASGIIKPDSPKVQKAIKLINDHNSVPSTENGVPNNAPAQIRETVKNITHRSRTDEQASRLVAHRLISIMGKGASLDGDDGFVTKSDLSRILGEGDIGDNAPVAEKDEVFSKFRTAMREIGSDLRSPAGQRKAASTISRMAINALVDEDELARIGTSAEELSSAFVATMGGKGNLDSIFEDLPASARSRIFDLYKENAQTTALIMRGFLSPDAKKDLQAMTFYGDMLRQSTTDSIFTSASDLTSFRGVHPALADGYRKEFIQNVKPKRRAAIEAFTARPLDDAVFFHDGGGSVPFDLLETRGRVAPPVTEGDLGTGVYLVRRVNEDLDALPNEELRWASERVAGARDRLSRELANYEGMRKTPEADDFYNDVVVPAMNRLRNATATEAGLWRMERARNQIEGQPKAVPFVARAKNSFDFSPETEYTFGTATPSSLDWVLSKLEADGLVKPTDADVLRSGLTTVNGREAFEGLVEAIQKTSSADAVTAANQLNDVLKGFGYDSVDTGNTLFLFDKGQARHIQDDNFGLEEMVVDAFGAERKTVAADLLETMLQGNVDRTDTSGLINAMQHMGIPGAIADTYKAVFTGKKINAADIRKVGTFMKAFGENSARIRQSGAHWLADKIKPVNGTGIYEKIDASTMKSLMVSRDSKGRPISILSALRSLPDAAGSAQRWVDRNKFWTDVKQPASHDAIVMALRLGDDAVNRLPPKLRETTKDIQKFFLQQYQAAANAGLPIGFRRNYVPQVWNTEAIKADPNAFVDMFRDYFVREMQRGEIPMSNDPVRTAEEKAIRLMRTLTEESGDGVLMPDNGLRTRMENPFFERVINLSPDQQSAASRFMVNDLEGIITRYADQMNRRINLTKEFGVGNHAVTTYLNILANGREAIIDALSNNKTVSIKRGARDETIDTRVEVTNNIISAIPGTREEIGQVVDAALDMLGSNPTQWSKNKERVRTYLMNVQDPEIVAAQPEYAKRVDAIVNALGEFGGRQRVIDSSELDAMVSTVATAARIPREGGNAAALKFSRNVRGFNSITLLGFTTLASIPDIGMAAIRSGNLAASVRGWKSMMTDPYAREMARSVGVGLETVLHEKMAAMYNDTGSKVTNSFFNATGLTGWTTIQREAAALIGFEAFKSEARRAQDLIASGQHGSKRYQQAQRFLSRYGLETYAQRGGPSLSDTRELANNDQLRYALMRFVNESIFSPNPNDIPLWAQTPAGQMVFQLKSFPLMMGRMSKYVLNEAVKHQNFGPLGMLFASAGLLGTSSLAIRDVAQRRGEDHDGDGRPDQLFRDRYATDNMEPVVRWYNNAMEGTGMELEAGSSADAVLGWLTEAFMVQGGFGLFADLLHSAVEQSDNGAYGQLRTLGAVFGPSFSLAADAAKVSAVGLQHVFSEDVNNADQRDAIRKILSRVPVAGAVKGVREPVVDFIAGEAE